MSPVSSVDWWVILLAIVRMDLDHLPPAKHASSVDNLAIKCVSVLVRILVSVMFASKKVICRESALILQVNNVDSNHLDSINIVVDINICNQ